MGYRGEDASRTRTDSRRQPPWQSSSATGPGATWAETGDSRGYGQHDEYSADDGYGYPRDDSYGGHEGSGYEGYGQDAQYGQPGEYDQRGGYADDGYRDEYGHGPGYGAGPGYGQSQEYGNYPALPSAPGGSGGSGGYPAQRGGYGQPGGQHARPGGYGHTGDFPTLGTGPDDGQVDLPGRYAGNDWYGQPGTASGSGFADTGTLDARAINSYGSGLQPAQLTAPVLPGVPYTGQQERYDGESYAGYESQAYLDGHPDYGDDRGYGAPQGYDAYDDYDDYQQPAEFGAGGYAPAAGGEGPDSYDDYADQDDPYQDRYGDGETAPRFGGRPPKRPKAGKDKPGKNGPGAGKMGSMRGKRPLLISALAVVAVIVLGAAAYTFVFRPKPAASNSTTTAGPLPTQGPTSAATAACVKQFGTYCHIEQRTDDPAPLTLNELFPPQFLNETDHNSFARVAAKLDKTCANAVIGQDLTAALQAGKCTQVLRASYVSGDSKMMGTIGVVNLGTTNEAHHAGKVVGANDFIAPLSASKGIASKLGKGTGVVQAEFKGHYLILTWAEFTSTKAPTTKAQDQQLEAFENDLVAGTANISLSQRMVNGAPATAGG